MANYLSREEITFLFLSIQRFEQREKVGPSLNNTILGYKLIFAKDIKDICKCKMSYFIA